MYFTTHSGPLNAGKDEVVPVGDEEQSLMLLLSSPPLERSSLLSIINNWISQHFSFTLHALQQLQTDTYCCFE